jgi:signal transduction histidine kinase
MVRRVILAGVIAACAVVAAGIGAWLLHVDTLAALMDAQAGVAQALLAKAGPGTDPQTVAAAIARRGLRVTVRPGTGLPGGGPLDGGPLGGGPPAGGPPDAPPFGGPPPAGPTIDPRAHTFDAIVADLAHITPRHVDGDDFGLIILPDPADLSRWLLADLGVCIMALVAIIFGVRTLATGIEGAALERRRLAETQYRRFLADAGHELRTPLTIVIGYIDVLAEHVDANDAKGERIVEGMRAETKRMRSLVEKMLQLSRLEARASLPQPIDVAATVAEVTVELRRQNPGRTIAAFCEPGLTVTCDEDDLFEALRNLAENALRYAPDSDVRISTARENGSARIDVADRGPGIVASDQPHVFERFYRGAASDGIHGSGLGLSIVRGVAERWGGTVSFVSGSDGTCFTLSLPAVAPATHPAEVSAR